MIAVHNQPRSITSLAHKQANLTEAVGLAGRRPSIIGGDFALHADPFMARKMLKRATPDVDTFDRKGSQRTDGLFASPSLHAAGGKAIDSGRWADHDWTRAAFAYSTGGGL